MRLPLSAVAFLLGVLSLQSFQQLPALQWLCLLPLLLLGIWRYRNTWLMAGQVYVAGLLWALLSAHLYLQHVLPESLAGQPTWVEGIVTDIPDSDDMIQRFELEVQQFQAERARLPKKLRLSWYSSPLTVRAGERWRLLVKLKPPHGLMNPGGFDYQTWLYQQGVHATGYVRDHADNRRLEAAPAYSVAAIRQQLATYLLQRHDDFHGVWAALAVGYKGAMAAQQWDTLITTGTNHLMAISGLHIGLVAGMVFWLVRRSLPALLLRRFSADQIAAVLALLCAAIYALLAGFAIPTQRALIMLLVVLGAVIAKRPVRAGQGLAVALLLVLILDPVSVLSAGFWFSFLAVAVIAFSLSARLGREPLLLQWGRLQWVIALMLFPLSLLLFQQTSLVAPLANLIMVPWVSFLVVPLVLLALPFIWLWPALAGGLLELAGWSLSAVWPLLNWLESLPLASWQQMAPTPPMLVLAMLGVLLLLAPKGVPQRWLGLLLVLPALLARPDRPAEGEFAMTLLDVGQGLSVFVQTRDHQLLFDTGARYSDSFDMGSQVVIPFLRSLRLSRLDTLIVSHGDNDHKGGTPSILRHINVGELLGQDLDDLQHPHKRHCGLGQGWQWNGVRFDMLHPDQDYPRRNNHACVLRVSNGVHSLLIAADIEVRVERAMLQNQPQALRSSVLIVPHHGSKTSSSSDWLDAVAPAYALVSAGYRNRFGHPARQVAERYRQHHIPLLNTAETGALQMVFAGEGSVLRPQSYRERHHRYWHQSPLR